MGQCTSRMNESIASNVGSILDEEILRCLLGVGIAVMLILNLRQEYQIWKEKQDMARGQTSGEMAFEVFSEWYHDARMKELEETELSFYEDRIRFMNEHPEVCEEWKSGRNENFIGDYTDWKKEVKKYPDIYEKLKMRGNVDL